MVRQLSEEGSDRSDLADTSKGSADAPAAVEVQVKPAVSVIMVRDGSDGLEVFVQHRTTTMDFAAGVVVYPGGRVDEQDRLAGNGMVLEESLRADHLTAWSKTEMAAVPGAPEMLIATAQREIAEETSAVLKPAALKPWANWVTPPGRTKRFDTYFYVARADDVSAPVHQTTEATHSEWLPTQYILAEEAAERLKLMRPTLVLVSEVDSYGSVDAIMSADRIIDPVRPGEPGKHG